MAEAKPTHRIRKCSFCGQENQGAKIIRLTLEHWQGWEVLKVHEKKIELLGLAVPLVLMGFVVGALVSIPVVFQPGAVIKFALWVRVLAFSFPIVCVLSAVYLLVRSLIENSRMKKRKNGFLAEHGYEIGEGASEHTTYVVRLD